MSTTAAHPEQILRDLHDLWAQLAAHQGEADGVLRACSLTLMVAAEDAPDALQVRETVGVLMHNHPCRAIILHPDGTGLDAHIFSECWKPFGKSQQICSEGIEIAAGGSQMEEAARFLVPLRVPDLPSVLWCRGPRAFEAGRFTPFFPLADKLIFDSAHVADAEEALEFLRRLQVSGRRVADLHWARITGWREVLAHLFDDGVMDPGDVTAVQVTHGQGRVTTCARYFAAWMRQALPKAQVTLASGDGRPGLRAVSLTSAEGVLSITRGDGRCVEVAGLGRKYRSLLPTNSEAALMREELGILGRDPVYERSLLA